MWVSKINSISGANRRRLGRRLWLVAAIVKKHSFSCSSAAPLAVKAWLVCRRRVKKTTDKVALRIQMLNSQLFERNQSIVQENERLRKQALLLSEENRLLQQKLQDQLRNPDKVLDS